jgi:hypothetical protein
MGRLFDLIRERNDLSKPEDIHALNVFLTRLLFCFYAEDTGIFEQGQMTSAIQSTTQEDGLDVDQFFTDLFIVLNLEDSAPERKSMAAHFQEFPYVNGGLFEADEPIPEFGRKARRLLIDCGSMDWSEINPDIFGSMFQAVIDEDQRGSLGQHYTSVSNIMKVIQPLFLDKLYAELEKSRKNERKLKELLLRLQNLRIFDPACGSGNFLIIAYKELRKLEMEVIDALNVVSNQTEMYYSGIKLSQFHGIEIDDFAHEVAVLSLWLAEHQMNIAFKSKFGYAEAALPLRDSGHIVCGNALRLNWKEVCPAFDETENPYEVYVCGNPPYLGARIQGPDQKSDMAKVFNGHPHYKDLDYVSAWFLLASNYVNELSGFAFVSTSSLFQGEQVGYLWKRIHKAGQEFFFCHEPFAWSNNAKGNAGVFCVVVGVSIRGTREKFLFAGNHWKKVSNISPYLVEGDDLVVEARKTPFESSIPKMFMGNMPRDGGHLILSNQEYEELTKTYPRAKEIIRELYGSKELLSGKKRYAIWINDDQLDFALTIPEISKRIEKVREFRVTSKAKTTNQYAKVPHQFAQRTTPPSKGAIVVPAITSGRRYYVPIFWFDESKISTNKNYVIPNGSLYDLAFLQSRIHFDWMRVVVGRNGSGYSYSINVVYNTFPRPTVTDAQRKTIESLAEEILLIREEFPEKTPAQLYDPEEMPKPLREAHKALDHAIEKLYRDKPFRDATERLEHLFARYEKLIAEEKAKKPAKKKAKGNK